MALKTHKRALKGTYNGAVRALGAAVVLVLLTSCTQTDGYKEAIGEHEASICEEPAGEFSSFSSRQVELIGADQLVNPLCVLVADSAELRSRGLMGLTELGNFEGMLFSFQQPTTNAFWMKDTLLPLVVGWFDSRGVLVGTARMDPCENSDSCVTYSPGSSYSYALELPADSPLADSLVNAVVDHESDEWHLKMSPG